MVNHIFKHHIKMKLLTVLATFIAVTLSYPTVKTWTLNELSNIIETSEGEPSMQQYYVDALNQIMYALFTGTNEDKVHAIIISPSGTKKWTLDELKKAVDDPALSPALRPYITRSLHYLLNNKPKGSEDTVEVAIPALDISTWSISDLSEAMDDPDTKPALMIFLEKANEEIKEAWEAGESKDNVTLVTPVGLVPVKDGPKPIIVSRSALSSI